MSNCRRIHLRKIRVSDSVYMLEWMHDPEIQKSFNKDMMHMTIRDAEKFCQNAEKSDKRGETYDLHWAIADKNDEYLGTISLKEIDLGNGKAEYAIVLRKKAQGKGYGAEATNELLKKAFEEIKLHKVYLTVLEENTIAIRMYEKCGFVHEGTLKEHLYKDGIFHDWRLYGILKNEFEDWQVSKINE